MNITTCDVVTLVASKATKQKNYTVQCCIYHALSILREKSAHAYPVQITNVQHQDQKIYIKIKHNKSHLGSNYRG